MEEQYKNKELEQEGDVQKWGYRFTVTEQQIKEDFIRALKKNRKMSMKSAEKAEIVEIEKQYHLFVYCGGPYRANWSATCFWTHEEKSTVYESQIVYVKNGIELGYQAEGSTPVSKIVPKTVSNTVIDKTEQVSGEFSDEYMVCLPSQGTLTPRQKWIREWTNKRYKKTGDIGEALDESDFNGCKVVDTKNYNRVLDEAKRRCRDHVSLLIKSERIPGNKYRDLTYDVIPQFEISSTSYMPVYRVKYSYRKKIDYIFFSGCERYEDFIDGQQKYEELTGGDFYGRLIGFLLWAGWMGLILFTCGRDLMKSGDWLLVLLASFLFIAPCILLARLIYKKVRSRM